MKDNAMAKKLNTTDDALATFAMFERAAVAGKVAAKVRQDCERSRIMFANDPDRRNAVEIFGRSIDVAIGEIVAMAERLR